MFKIRKPNFEILIILIFGLIPLLWFKYGYLAAGHDMSYPLAPIDFWLDRLFVWTDRIGSFGSNQTDAIPGIFIHGLQALFYALTGSLQLAQKFDFIFWFTLPGITMYILLKSLHPEKESFVLRITGSLFYMMNHYLLQAWIIAEMSKFSIVSALPLVILAIINVNLRNGSVLKNSVLVGLTFIFLNGGAGIPLWGGLIIAAFSFFLITFLSSKVTLFKKIVRAVLFMVLVIIFFSLLNLYWLFPYLSSFKQNFTDRIGVAGGGEGAVGWSHEISKNASFTNLFKLQGIPDMYDNDQHPYAQVVLKNPLFIAISILLPIIVFSNFLTYKIHDRDRRVYLSGFFSILILSLPFVAGSHSPFGFIYDFLLRYLPGFSIFRTPIYKFGMALWFAYAYLFAVGIHALIQHIFIRHKVSPKYQICLLGILIGVLFLYNYPFFTGIFFNWSKKYSTIVKVPDYIFEAGKELDSNKFSTRTILIPGLNPDTKYESYNWKYFSLSPVTEILSRKSVIINDVALKGLEVNVLNDLYNQLAEGNTQILRLTGADRLIIRNDFSAPDTEIYQPQKLIDSIKKNAHFTLYKTIGQWDYYQIKDIPILPLIFSPSSISFLSSQSEVIKLASELPTNPINEPFLYRALENRQNISDYMQYISRFTLQGSCVNCTPERFWYSLSPVFPKVLPGSKLYQIIKLLEEVEKSRISDPSKKIDFIIGNISKRVFIFENFVKDDKKNQDLIKQVLEEWEKSLAEIYTTYSLITDSVVREQNAIKIYYYSRQFLVLAQKWRGIDQESHQYYPSELTGFADFLKSYISIPEFIQIQKETNLSKRKYLIGIPQDGQYRVYILLGSSSTQSESIKVIIDTYTFTLQKNSRAEEWFRSPLVDLKKGDSSVIFPEQQVDFTPVLSLPDFTIKAQNLAISCHDVPITNLDTGGTYRVKFNFEGISRSYLNLSIIEEGDYESKPPPDRKYIKDFLIEEKGTSNYENSFGLSKSTSRLVFRFCVDPYSQNLSAVSIQNFNVGIIPSVATVFAVSEEKPISYNPLEFVALNQTKYLFRFTGDTDSAILQFNSRFDDNWKIRAVDPNQAKRFFKGEKRSYSATQTVEYARQDSHVATDLVFPRRVAPQPRPISINRLTNIWFLNGVRGQVLLLEYQAQNDFYRVAFISAVTFVVLVIWVIYIKFHGK